MRKPARRASSSGRPSPAGDRQFEILARFSPVGIFRADTEGGCVFVNERWCEITGLGPDEALGKGWERALHREDLDLVTCGWRQAMAQQGRTSLEYRVLRPDGEVV